MTSNTSAGDRRAGVLTRHRLFWGGLAAVTAGVGLHVPRYISAFDLGGPLAAKPVDALMVAGMATIVAGMAGVAVWTIPPRSSGIAEPVSVRSLDNAPITRAHVGLILIMSLAVAIDLVRPLTIAFAVPGLAALDSDGVPFELLGLATLIGAVVGSFVWGRLGDRIGRRPSILIGATIMIGSAATGTMPDPLNVIVCFVMGMAAGGLLPIAFALVAETMPSRHRGWLMVLMGAPITAAYVLTSSLASAFNVTDTWLIMWLLGLPAGLLLILLGRWIPESPRFLIATGRGEEAESILRRYGAELVVDVRSPLDVEQGVQSSWRQLLHVPFRNSTAVVLLMGLGAGFVFFAFQLWIPSNLESIGFSAQAAADIVRNAALIGLPATLAVALLYGFWSSRGTIIVVALVTAAALVTLALAGVDRDTARAPLYALLSVPIVGAASMLAILGTYGSELFPTKIRSRANGVGAGTTKAAGAVVVALVVVGLTPPTIVSAALIGAVTMALVAMAVLVAGVETRGRALERITTEHLQVLSATQSEDWDSKWARDDFRPPWRIATIPSEVVQAAGDGWLPAGGSVLDVGCGAGEIAAWLAGRGYQVVGIDFASAAIDRARAEHPEHERLGFAVGDLCGAEPPLEERFDAALDRGCLHAVPIEIRPDYVRNVARMLHPDAPMLIFHRVAPESSAAGTEAAVRGLLEGHFDVQDVAETVMVERGDDGAPVKGLALRLTRRSSEQEIAMQAESSKTNGARARGKAARTEVAIIGGGPAGACAAMYLREQGVDAVIVEKKPFPRYHVGESMTGEAGGVLRRLGLEARLDAAGHAIKHGVNVWGKAAEWFVPVMQRTADGSLAEQYTWQVRRSEFDAMLLDEACSRGADLVRGKAVKPLLDDVGGVRGLRVRPEDGDEFRLEADMVLDCSGQATFMAAQGVTGPKYLGAYDKQIAIFSQVTDFERDAGDNGRKSTPGNTQIFYKGKYHWSWAIPLDDEVTSVGVVIPSQYFVDRHESKEQFLRRELAELHPELARRLPTVEFAEDFHAVPNYSFQVRGFAGPGFICVGDSHRFVDPIFSFGVHVAIHEAELAADATMRWLGDEGRDSGALIHEHMVECERRIDIFEDLIDCFWQDPLAFAFFAHARYTESLVDAFAGRGGTEETLPIVAAARKVLKRTRTYDAEGLFSVPFGSRYRPDDAPRWDESRPLVETTEAWMRDG